MPERIEIPNIHASRPDDLRSSRVTFKNQALAYEAIREVRRVMPVRSLEHPNMRPLQMDRGEYPRWMLGRFEQVWRVAHESERVEQREDENASFTIAHRLARLSSESRAGAQATLAFAYLLSHGVRPLDYMHVAGREQAFVLIGRADPVSALTATEQDDERTAHVTMPSAGRAEIRPESWGADAVVCDPYRGLALRLEEILRSEYYDEYHPAESQLRVPLVHEAALDL
jgi:hypothetical protein